MKWLAFLALERLADLGVCASALVAAAPSTASGPPGLWVFASTIGELNATAPFLRSLHLRLRGLRLILITDRTLYAAAFAEIFPAAVVFVTQGHSRDARRLRHAFPPELLVIAEIPCLIADAPCRFSYAFLRTAKQAGAAVCLVNGWIYGYAPSCRMDRLERTLFGREFVRQLDVACVQNQEAAAFLVARGADPARVLVTGNIKFDAMQRRDWSPDLARSPELLKSLFRDCRPIVVAGCVTDYLEQVRVLDAFVRLRAERPDALLVMAPRHPEVAEHMSALAGFIAERGLLAAFRSRSRDGPLAAGVVCLVLDTIGDLADFYAAAAVCYVGVDHNLLEPLAFDKVVTVGPGWNPTYPSYPIYRALMDAGGVVEVSEPVDLARIWLAILDGPTAGVYQDRAHAALERQFGAADRCMAALTALFGPEA